MTRSVRQPDLDLQQVLGQVLERLDRIEQAQAMQRLAAELDARQGERRLSPDELDLIVRQVFQRIQRKMARAWGAGLAPAPASSTPAANSSILTNDERARITAQQLEREARRELKRYAKRG